MKTRSLVHWGQMRWPLSYELTDEEKFAKQGVGGTSPPEEITCLVQEMFKSLPLAICKLFYFFMPQFSHLIIGYSDCTYPQHCYENENNKYL